MPTAGAVRFVRHLRELARARHEPVRDLGACPQVHWLAELPGEVRVATDAAAGDVLFSVPVIPITPPEDLTEFDSWLALRKWHRTLRALATEEHEGYELVLAIGLLTLPHARVRSHLLTTPVQVVMDANTEQIDVVLGDRAPVLHDREMLEGVAGYRTDRMDWVRDTVHAGQGFGLQDSVADVLRKWCAHAFDLPVGPIGFREDWGDDPVGGAARVRLAPALVLRPLGRWALLDHLDGMLAELEDGAAVPPAVEDFVTGQGQGRRLAYVRDRTPESVAGLLEALLARGRRVLVATTSPGAAADILASLPAELAPLVATPARAADCRSALAEHTAAHDPEQHDRHLSGLQQRLSALNAVAEDLRRQIQTAREQEVYDLAPGYEGTVAELAAKLDEAAAGYSWMPLGEHLSETVPVSAAEAAELLELLAGRTAERAARSAQLLPEPSTLPAPAAVRELTEAERTAIEQAARSPLPELTAKLAACPPATLSRLAGCGSAVASAIGELGLPPDPARWDPARDWAARAVRDLLARRAGAWDHVSELAVRAAEVDRAARYVGTRRVLLQPLPEGVVGLPAARFLHDRIPVLRTLRDHLAAGGAMRRGPLRSAAQKAAEPMLEGVTVDDDSPSTAEHLDIIMAAVEGRAAVHELAAGWRAAGVAFPVDRSLGESAGWFATAYARLSHVRTALRAVGETASMLYSAGLRMPLGSPEEWREFTAALSAVRPRLAADRARASLSAVEEALGLEIRKGQPPPELRAALAAVQARDADGYDAALAGLAEAHGERLVEARCEQLYERVAEAHPRLAELLALTPASESPAGPTERWAGRFHQWTEAWQWARAATAFRNLPRPQAQVHLEEELRGTMEQHTRLAAEFSVEQAWSAALERRRVPAWLVPLWQVPVEVPLSQGSFDAVIVDEGATADEEGLFLLWRAPRIILTGPPEQGPLRVALEERLGAAGMLAV